MDEKTIYEQVAETGRLLLEKRLVARTWGNFSARLDETHFVITPSGLGYEQMAADDMVRFCLADETWKGTRKPSSEKGIHAQCYLLRPACNFVIHTHQANASIISALGADINDIEGKAKEIIGDNVPLAAYGLPGTGKLRKGVVRALKRSDSKAVIMKHHGAVCLGKDYDEAFAIASALEDVCKKVVFDRCSAMANKPVETFREVCDYVTELKKRADAPAPKLTAYDSSREGNVVKLQGKDGSEKAIIGIAKENIILGDWPGELDMHVAIYKAREDVNYIIQSQDEAVVAASKITKVLRPLLDDFAQIAGTTVKTAFYNPNDILKTKKNVVKALGKHKNAALLKDNGAVCVGSSQDEAEAAERVTAKNCKTFVSSGLYEKVKPIGKVDSVLMNVIYRLKYSKQK